MTLYQIRWLYKLLCSSGCAWYCYHKDGIASSYPHYSTTSHGITGTVSEITSPLALYYKIVMQDQVFEGESSVAPATPNPCVHCHLWWSTPSLNSPLPSILISEQKKAATQRMLWSVNFIRFLWTSWKQRFSSSLAIKFFSTTRDYEQGTMKDEIILTFAFLLRRFITFFDFRLL